mmetsp:Transcript_57566/g.106361  ORF Transcript_57566/g.106361 Transcript_57566/m.106361 type:complete len:329 (+) Transcript_57566:117-1103(+)
MESSSTSGSTSSPSALKSRTKALGSQPPPALFCGAGNGGGASGSFFSKATLFELAAFGVLRMVTAFRGVAAVPTPFIACSMHWSRPMPLDSASWVAQSRSRSRYASITMMLSTSKRGDAPFATSTRQTSKTLHACKLLSCRTVATKCFKAISRCFSPICAPRDLPVSERSSGREDAGVPLDEVGLELLSEEPAGKEVFPVPGLPAVPGLDADALPGRCAAPPPPPPLVGAAGLLAQCATTAARMSSRAASTQQAPKRLALCRSARATSRLPTIEFSIKACKASNNRPLSSPRFTRSSASACHATAQSLPTRAHSAAEVPLWLEDEPLG